MAPPAPFDLDAIQMLWMVQRMRDEGKTLDGRPIRQPPALFLGAAASPFATPPKYEAIRTEKKVNAGAQFIQTQPIFDVRRFSDWLEALDKRNLLDKLHILAGVMPLKSARAAHFLAGRVPGVVIPPHLVQRMERAGDEAGQQREGFTIALEILEKLRRTPGIRGVHIMALHWENIVPELVTAAGIPSAGGDDSSP